MRTSTLDRGEGGPPPRPVVVHAIMHEITGSRLACGANVETCAGSTAEEAVTCKRCRRILYDWRVELTVELSREARLPVVGERYVFTDFVGAKHEGVLGGFYTDRDGCLHINIVGRSPFVTNLPVDFMLTPVSEGSE